MKKAERQAIFDKYDGHCAYCGEKLQKGWHVDEIEPVGRLYKYIPAHWKNKVTGETSRTDSKAYDGDVRNRDWIYEASRSVPDGYKHPENFRLDNQMPSCASCNINKHGDSLEGFRQLISGFMKHLNERNVQYKIAKRYGLVSEHIKPVKFYFEQFVSGTCYLCKKESNLLHHHEWGDGLYCLKCEAIADKAELN